MNISEGKVATKPGKKVKQKNSLIIPKTATDLQKIKLERLMQEPDKPIIIPPGTREKKVHDPPEFVRNVMGSSAGAGSGEFHVYRHLRRKEYARQKYIDEKATVENKNDEYHNRLEENRKKAEEKTSKKRAKRQKKKQLKKRKSTNSDAPKKDESEKETETEDDSDEGENNEKDD